jgi:hypothetical protein
MAYFIGVFLAFAVAAGASLAGLDKERSFYSTVLIVVASYYDLFAVIGGSAPALSVETGVFVLFAAAAVAGFKFNPWILVAGLALHGVFDLVHGDLVLNPGVPGWWPAFCMSYDVAAAIYLAWRLAGPTRIERG